MNHLVSKETLLSAVTWCERHHTATVDLEALLARIPSLRLRPKEARSALRKHLSGQERVRWIENAIVLSSNNAEGKHGIAKRLKECADILDAIATRALTPKEICKALEISNQERLRWTKDGRLKTSGTLTFAAGRRVTVPTYSARWVADLVKNHRIIDAWRKQDAA
ncbi:hypothetical protein [Qipengyuania citrea]|uniref:hypothetical protein n=1 Tax=Qipengyuania citrea TaxID=225971 RepID=UPI00329846D4